MNYCECRSIILAQKKRTSVVTFFLALCETAVVICLLSKCHSIRGASNYRSLDASTHLEKLYQLLSTHGQAVPSGMDGRISIHVAIDSFALASLPGAPCGALDCYSRREVTMVPDGRVIAITDGLCNYHAWYVIREYCCYSKLLLHVPDAYWLRQKCNRTRAHVMVRAKVLWHATPNISAEFYCLPSTFVNIYMPSLWAGPTVSNATHRWYVLRTATTSTRLFNRNLTE